MPSPTVRIKRSDYSTLRQRAQDDQPPRTLANIFKRPRTTEPVPDSEQDRAQDPFGTARVQRPRASSRIQDHVISQSLGRQFGQPQPEPDRRSLSSASDSPEERAVPSPFITIHGPTTDVLVHRGAVEEGVVGSALSLPQPNAGQHEDDIVEHLDVIDPQVATVSNLANAANSILIPPLSWYSRKPIVILTAPSGAAMDPERASTVFEDDLDRHVDDVLHRRMKIRRTLLGVWSFLKTPIGIVTSIYGFLVVFWGAAIVIFLAKIINFHNSDTQGFWVEVSSQVENGLFTVTGIGLIPSRVLDTYRICKIWYYKRKTQRLRDKAGLPQLFDVDDLPDPMYDPNYVHVLTDEEQKDLHRQQVKFHYHQTWYRAHGTETHRAFPINLALIICFLNDGNSIFQIMLCATMWSLNRFERPAWSTGILIPASFLCGIFSAIVIARGGKITKRTKKVEERLRAVLSTEPSSPPGNRQKENIEEEVDETRLKRLASTEPSPNATSGYKADDTDIEPMVVEEMTVPPAEAKVESTSYS